MDIRFTCFGILLDFEQLGQCLLDTLECFIQDELRLARPTALSATALIQPDDFAQRLERAILRSGKAIEADAVALPQPE